MKVSIKAVLIGLLVAFSGNIIRSILLAFFIHSNSSLPSTISEYNEVIISYVSLAISILFNIAAGYIAAKIADKNELLHGIITGFVLWIIGELTFYSSYISATNEIPNIDIRTLLSLFWLLLYCLLGAFIRKRIKDKTQAETNIPLEQKIENLGNN
jgi:putative membrane protein (TIGR04086 family)